MLDLFINGNSLSYYDYIIIYVPNENIFGSILLEVLSVWTSLASIKNLFQLSSFKFVKNMELFCKCHNLSFEKEKKNVLLIWNNWDAKNSLFITENLFILHKGWNGFSRVRITGAAFYIRKMRQWIWGNLVTTVEDWEGKKEVTKLLIFFQWNQRKFLQWLITKWNMCTYIYTYMFHLFINHCRNLLF